MILGRRERILVFPVYKTFMLHLQGLLKLMENAQCYLLKEPEDRIQWAIATTEIWGGKTPEKEKIRKKEPQILCVTLTKSLEAQLKLKELNRVLRGYPQQGNRVWYFAFNQINCLLLKKKKKNASISLLNLSVQGKAYLCNEGFLPFSSVSFPFLFPHFLHPAFCQLLEIFS